MSKDKQICTSCGKSKKLSEYYMSKSPFHKHFGRISVCKSCFWSYVGEKNDEFNINRLIEALRMIDRPYLEFLIHSSIQEAERDNKSIVKIYMKNIAMGQYENLNWNDSEFKGFDKFPNKVSLSKITEEINEEELQDLINFFGEGFERDDYIWLRNEYEDFLNRYEVDSKGMELLIKEICLTQLDIKHRRAKGEKVDTQLKTLQDLLGSSNLKPVQETGANSVEQETFGTLIKKYENERPIPDPDPQWKDVDNISKYIKVFFLGHLSRMLGIKNDYANEYWEEINKYTVEEPNNENEEDEMLNG